MWWTVELMGITLELCNVIRNKNFCIAVRINIMALKLITMMSLNAYILETA